MRSLSILLILPLLTFLCGCGGSSEPGKGAAKGGGGTAEPEAEGSSDDGCGCGEEMGGDWTPDKGTATVSGFVKFEGEAPARRPIDFGAEQYCLGAHKTPMLNETYIVGSGGGLANAFVQVKSGLKGWKFATPSGTQTIDQAGCAYIPHVLALGVGQTLTIRNSDPIMHNIHAFDLGTNKDEFNFAQTQKGMESTRSFRRPTIMQVKCDVHGWMGAFIHVVKHPFHFVTGEDGAFQLPKLPAGTYEIEAWHEKLGTKTATVTVADGDAKEISFTFSK